MSGNKRVGILAGSFDPIHDGHLAIAKDSIKYLELDKLLFVVEKSPWTNKKPINIRHRKNMIELAIEDTKKISQLDLADERFDLQTTLPKIEAIYPAQELYFIFGADVFLRMNAEQWPDLDRLLRHYIVVFERKNNAEDTISEHAVQIGAKIAIFPSPHPHHSSTDIRLQPHNKQVWVPKKVADYIDTNNLYV